MAQISSNAKIQVERLAGDLDTPVSAYLKLSASFGPGFLLESVQGGAARGRYSILGFQPDLTIRAGQNGGCVIERGNEKTEIKMPILDALRGLIEESKVELPERVPRHAAGIFGIMGYDCIRDIENVGAAKSNVLDLPRSIFIRPQLIVVFDSVRDEIIVVTVARTPGAEKLMDKALVCLRARAPLARPQTSKTPGGVRSNVGKDNYIKMVRDAKTYIEAGDVFQVVLSQRFEDDFTLPPFTLYRALRRTNPSPYLFFFDFSDFALAGSSPEICVQLHGDKITLRPIAGTIRRGKTLAEDKANGDKLLNDPKERAEHLMLLDLGRNDVGRVAEMRSIEIDQQFKLEHYSEVIHIVSQVRGTLQKGKDCIDVLKAAFPAGTVSGAPKVRAMQIINELEPEARGFYAGCVGYFSSNGDMDTAIILRTGIVKDNKLYVQAGAGIVADSIPENEHAECEAKARAVFRAAELAREMIP